MRKIQLLIGAVALVGLITITVITKAQEINLKGVNQCIADYYYISSPNGNVLEIEQDGLLCEYDIKKYDFSTAEDNGHITYKSKTEFLGDTRFYPTGISGDINVNYETEFPKCVAEKNDSLTGQLLFHPSTDGEVESTDRGHGKLYISLKNAHSLSETAEIIESLKKYGEVTWLWVDTYGNEDISGVITVQNPFSAEKNALVPNKYTGVYGIPLYYNGKLVENSTECFLRVLNGYDNTDDNFCQEKIFSVKNSIKPDGGAVTEENIKIIGLVLLISDETDRDEAFAAILNNDAVRAVN